MGRFAQADSVIPLASQGVQAWDRYAGMNNNPVRYNDPSGHDIEQIMFDKYYDKYGSPKKIEKRDTEGWSNWLLKYGGAEPIKLTVAQKIGKAVTAFVVEVVIVLPMDFSLLSLTIQAPRLGIPGILAEVVLIPADVIITDFAISFPYDIYLDISTGYENDFEWILTNSILSELPLDWQNNIHEVLPGILD